MPNSETEAERLNSIWNHTIQVQQTFELTCNRGITQWTKPYSLKAARRSAERHALNIVHSKLVLIVTGVR